MRRRDLVVLVASGVLTALMAGHTVVPGVAGVALDSLAPWLGLAIPLLAVVGLVGRSRAAVVLLVPAVVWAGLFGVGMLARASAGTGDLRVVTQNLYANNADPSSTAARLDRTGADVIGVQELSAKTRDAVGDVLGGEHPHHVTMGTVGLWSRYPIEDAEPVDLGLGWTRAVRAQVRTPRGPLVVYVAHLPSLRPDSVEQRNRGLAKLAEAVLGDRSQRIVVLADLNTASTDRAMRLFGPGADEDSGFTWPSAFPIARLDHVLCRGVRTLGTDVLPTPGSDHRAVLADLAW